MHANGKFQGIHGPGVLLLVVVLPGCVLRHEVNNRILTDPEAKVAESFVRISALGFIHLEDGLQSFFKSIELHLWQIWHSKRSAPSLLGVPAKPDLIHVFACANECQLCHVGTRTTIGTTGSARDKTHVSK